MSATSSLHRLARKAVLLCALGAGFPVSVSPQASTTNPHGPLPADIDCVACHSPAGWSPVRAQMDFDHTLMTAFALTGRHTDASCITCHFGARFDEPKASEADCTSCHFDVHQGNQSKQCTECHNTINFGDVAGVMMHAQTMFPLSGVHLQVTCEACHADDRGGAFATIDSDCFSCHEENYTSTQSLDHVNLLISTECANCHNTLAWSDGTQFDHASEADGFELIGAHNVAPCASCHVIPGYALLFATTDQNDCVTCHQSDHDAQHGTGFPTDCVRCHTIDTWVGGTFDHLTASSGFQLLGAHNVAPCASCHVIPGYTPLFATTDQNDCVTCHQSDHDAQHGTGFPTDCVRCHTIDTWVGATFDHDGLYFPIYSGRHNGRWNNDCTTCHEVPGNFQQFTCFNCHAHDQGLMDEAHRGRNNYVYESTACLSCHPNGIP